MNASELERERWGGINEAARERILSRKGEPLFLADWERAVFIHYEVDAEILQREVPFQLDLREGKAYVSLVAFTMRRMRPRFGGRFAEWLFKPIATHEFLNVRTYVRHNGEPGIYFLAEWLSNPLSVHLGPRTFGLPYRFGRIEYFHEHEKGLARDCFRSFVALGIFCRNQFGCSIHSLRGRFARTFSHGALHRLHAARLQVALLSHLASAVAAIAHWNNDSRRQSADKNVAVVQRCAVKGHELFSGHFRRLDGAPTKNSLAPMNVCS